MVLATGVILRSLHQRANFYSACVYLGQSNACVMVRETQLWRVTPSSPPNLSADLNKSRPPRGIFNDARSPEAILRSTASY